MNEFWVDRSHEGRALAERLLSSSAPIIVLYGVTEGGKTDFIRDTVFPLMPRATYRNATLGDLETVSQGEFIFIDSFEEILLQADSSRKQPLAQSLRLAEQRRFKLVLITGQECLNRMFQLQQDLPQLMEDAIELPPIGIPQLFDTFLNVTGGREIHISKPLRDELLSDLELCSAKANVDPELFAILAVEFKRLQKGDKPIGKEDYEGAGKLLGMLESHVDALLDGAADKFDPQMTWAVLDSAANNPSDERCLIDVATRYDVSDNTPLAAIGWLQKETTLVRNDKLGRQVVRPRQLAAVLDDRRQRDVESDEHLTLMLRQGARHFLETSTYLSESSFRKIHARRSTIRANESESKLMLRCALAYEDARAPQAAGHWLRRLQSPDAAVDVLLDSSFDCRPETRQRAAAHLRDFNRPEVRHQLHLLAIRDSSAAVRFQATESLNSIKDDALRNALILEVNDAKSPYRMAALETLRIFNDQETARTLLKIIRDPNTKSLSAREKAIEVLGRQDAVQPADTLLKIALGDEDWKNRHDAAGALSLMKSEEPLRAILEKLRLQPPKPALPRTPFSLTFALLTPIYAGLAVLAVFLTFFIHGVLLAAFGRWRLAIAVTVIEVASAAVLGATDSLAGVWMFLLTLAIGLLVPTRMMLVGRRQTATHSRFRRWVDLVLGGIDSVTFFLVFPGLPPLLAGHVKRGLGLIGIGVAGMALVVGALFFKDQFASYIPLSLVFTVVPQGMEIIGGVLLAVAYISGLGFTLLNSFLWPHKKEWKERIDSIYSALLSNPAASRVVVEKLTTGKPDESAWAASLIRKYRRLFQQSIEADSVNLLKSAVPTKGWRVTCQYLCAVWNMYLAAIPKYLAVSGTVGFFALIAFSAVTYELIVNSPPRLMAAAQNSSFTAKERSNAVMKLKLLAVAIEPQPFAVDALTKTVLFESLEDNLRQQTRQALKDVARERVELQGNLISPIAEALKNPGTKSEIKHFAIQALQYIGVRPAALELEEFVLTPPRVGARGKGGTGQTVDPNLALKLAAILAIQNMDDLGRDGVEILTNIQENTDVVSEVKQAATEAIANFDPLGLAETEFDRGTYSLAILHSEAAIQKLKGDPRAERAQNVLSVSHLRLGREELMGGQYDSAKSHFTEALKYKGDSANLGAAIDLGLDLIYEAHENVAVINPTGYRDAYEMASNLRPLGDRANYAKAGIDANAAEATLTMGKYDEAEGIAAAVLHYKELQPETRLNTHMIALVARVLKQDQRGAAKARQDLLSYYDSLPQGFKNGWSYSGTKYYLSTSRLPKNQINELLALMDKIENKD